MKRKRLFNDNWEFTLLDNGSTLADTENAEFKPVPLWLGPVLAADNPS